MSLSFTIKKTLAKVYDLFGINSYKQKKLNKQYNNNYIRIINYHMTPISSKENFEKQVQWLLKNFENCDMNKLELFLDGKYQFKDKPGIMFTFDDGFLDNYQVAYPILKKYNATGYYFVSTGLIGKKRYKNKDYNIISNYMTQDQILELINKKHVIGCHTDTHHRMNIIVKQEIKIFCWCGGEENTYTQAASDVIKQAGYKYSMTTLSSPIISTTNHLLLDRINIESWWSMSMVRFCISGYMDHRFKDKRNRVHNLIK